MNHLYLILSNLFYISAALIPFILLHCFMFHDKMGRKKLIFSIIAAVFIIPLICAYPCYITAFKNIKDPVFIGLSLLYIFAYMGLIAFNYFIFLLFKFKREENKTKTSRFIISFLLLAIMIYLAMPAYLSFLSLKLADNVNLSTKLSKIAYTLSPFPYIKNIPVY